MTIGHALSRSIPADKRSSLSSDWGQTVATITAEIRKYVLILTHNNLSACETLISNPVDTSRHPVKNEARLAELWSRAHRLCEFLETRDGYKYRVVHPGVQNTAAGPDFRGAVLEDSDGRRVVGDIELHIAARDWYSHGHHADANYNGVVVHVVINGSSNRDTVQQSGTKAPVAEFSIVTAGEPSELPDPRLNDILSLNLEELAEILDTLGDQRFAARSQSFTMEHSDGEDPDQALYRAMMEALGFRSNQETFRQLANLVPYSTFRRYRDDPYETRVTAIESALISASGLLGGLEVGPRKSQLERLARKSRRFKKLKAHAWKLFRVRPNNHPAQRISGFARVLAKSTVVGLAAMFKAAILQQELSGVAGLLEERPYIGSDRANEMVMNVVLPYLHSFGVMAEDRRLSDLCLNEYRSMSALPTYGTLERFAKSVGIPTDRKFIKKARRQQGLLHLQKHFADHIDTLGVSNLAKPPRA